MALAGLFIASFLVYRLTGSRLSSPQAIFVYLALWRLGVRPLIFALGFDTPRPEYLFTGQYHNDTVMVTLLSILWLGAFSLGFVYLRSASRKIVPIFPVFRSLPDKRVIGAAVLATTSVAVFAHIPILQQGLSLKRSIHLVRRENFFEGLEFLAAMPELGGVLAAVSFLYELYLRRRGYGGSNWFLILAITAYVVAAGLGLVQGNRATTVFPLVLVVFAYPFAVGRRPLPFMVCGIILPLALVAGLQGVRDEMLEISRPPEYQRVWRQVSHRLNLTTFDKLILVQRDWGSLSSNTWGGDLASGVVAPVPRFIWEDKPAAHRGRWFRQKYQPEAEGGWPIVAWGQWYMAFGPLGVVLSGLVAGLIFRALSMRYESRARNDVVHLVTAALIAVAVVPAGYTQNSALMFVLFVGPISVIAWLSNVRQDRKHLGLGFGEDLRKRQGDIPRSGIHSGTRP